MESIMAFLVVCSFGITVAAIIFFTPPLATKLYDKWTAFLDKKFP